MKRIIILVFILVVSSETRAQSHFLTIYPMELMSKTVTAKYEFLLPNAAYSLGVFYSYFNHTTNLDYTGHKVCPFIRFNQLNDNKLEYIQIKLIGGYFDSKLKYIYEGPSNGPDSHTIQKNYYAAGVGFAAGYQYISKKLPISLDFSIGTQIFPQLVDKEITHDNKNYKLGSSFITIKNTNGPWIFFGPGSILEFKLGIGFTDFK